jgi:GntR family transcriptional regulator of arabinose operon
MPTDPELVSWINLTYLISGARRYMKVVPKYQFVLESLEREIVGGKYQPGDKVPSEAALVHRFKSSRITVGRALKELVQRGLVDRRAGSGTYVCQMKSSGWLFGLLIAELGNTEIFDPICRGMAHAPQARTTARVNTFETPGNIIY